MKKDPRSTCELCGKWLTAVERLMFDRCKACRVPSALLCAHCQGGDKHEEHCPAVLVDALV
jgi:hypothetical protein